MNKGFTLDGTRVDCRDEPIERSLRRFKNKVADGGILMDLKERNEGYAKPSIKRKKAKDQARRRWLRQLKMEQLPPKLY
jgi:ribosomal protein S21